MSSDGAWKASGEFDPAFSSPAITLVGADASITGGHEQAAGTIGDEALASCGPAAGCDLSGRVAPIAGRQFDGLTAPQQQVSGLSQQFAGVVDLPFAGNDFEAVQAQASDMTGKDASSVEAAVTQTSRE